MFYHQHTALCCASRIGANGLPDVTTLAQNAKAIEAVETLRAAYQNKGLALLRIAEKTDDLAAIEKAAQRLKNADDVVFLGTGGSSLGGQALVQIAGWHVAGVDPFLQTPRLHFFDNLDAVSFDTLLSNIALERTQFVTVSKSGGTAETLVQTLLVTAALEAKGLKLAEHCLGLTEPDNWKPNILRQFLSKSGVHMLEHETSIGGRYSALTNVGLLPAAVIGLDIRAIREGAQSVIKTFLQAKDITHNPPALGAVLMLAFDEKQISENVIMAYSDRLERFTAWFSQLWAESVGKQGKGTTPVRALGPVDQHSQLQLFLDGPANKVFTILTTGQSSACAKISLALAARAGVDEFANKGIADLVAAQSAATAETLAKRGRPVRTLHVDELNAQAIGALMMHFFLETIIAAHMLEIDAFDQPAVEEGKILAKAYLARGNTETAGAA